MSNTIPAVRLVIDAVADAARRDHRRRVRRRKAIRIAALSALVLAGLSTAALAAGGAFRVLETVTPVGEVELPQHVTIQAVDSFPEFVGRATTNGFTTSTTGPHSARYLYHVTGGEARELGCGFPQVPTNNIYITSTRPLSEQEIRAMLRPDGELDYRSPEPPWITSTSNGCPNPGIAGQPGSPGGPLIPGRAAVTPPTSTRTHILIRKRTRVPAQQGTPATPPAPERTQATPPPPPPATTPSASPSTTGAPGP